MAQANQIMLENWRDELNSAAIFRILAELERKPRQRAVFTRLADIEEGHARHWAAHYEQAGGILPEFKPRRRTRLLQWVARHMGSGLVLPSVARLEQLEADGYLSQLESEHNSEEQENANLLKHIGHHEFSEFVKKLILKVRPTVQLFVGLSLFVVSLLLARNAQLEGLFFGLFAGIVVGPVMHYLLGKLLIPLPFGRLWCGWACWTAAVLEQLPYRKRTGWLAPKWRRLRYLHFALSLALITLLAFGFGYGGGAVGYQAALWFGIGNVLYWTLGIILAVTLKDNRAFCKYACPVAVILKVTSRPALFKIAGEASACQDCKSRACTKLCPMDIQIPDYILAGERVLSSECIFCQQCVAACPPNTLNLSLGFDVGGKELLERRSFAVTAIRSVDDTGSGR